MPSEYKEIDLDQDNNSAEIEAEIKREEERWNNSKEGEQTPPASKSEPKAPDSQEESNESSSKFGVHAAKPEKMVFLDPKVSSSKSEVLEKIKVNKEVNDLIEKAAAKDRKQHESGDLQANLAGEITKILTDMKHEYSQLLKISNSLQVPNMEFIKVQLARRKYVMDQPGPEVFMEDSCVPLDKSSDSLALKRMLNIIYSRHIYNSYDIKFVQGPICRPEDRPPTIEELYNKEPPSKSLNTIDYSKLLFQVLHRLNIILKV